MNRPDTQRSSLSADGKEQPPFYEQGNQAAPPLENIDQSAGVKRIAAIADQITPTLRIWLFFGVFLAAYTYSLDSTVRGVFTAQATSSYSEHSLLATINVLRSIISAAAQPPLAKIADVFGRTELIIVSIIFYLVGTIIEAAATGVKSFCAGAVFYQIGFTAIILLVEITIGDTTSLRSRLFFSYIPALPFLINTWVSGDVTNAVLAGTTWRWGVGMWCIIYPVCCLPLLSALWIASRRAKRSGQLDGVKSAYRQVGFKGMVVRLFWELDVVGLILLIALLSLILLPFTLAGGESKSWGKPRIPVMLVIGLLCVPAFAYWETKLAKFPCVPFHLLKDRTVLGCLGLACLLNCCWYLQGDYLYTVLVVSLNESVKSATRISSLYSFTSVIVGVALGVVVRFVHRLKPFMIAGVLVFLLAFGLLIRYRGGSADHAGIIAGQVVLGVAGGLFPYPGQALIQSATKRQHLAIITSLYLSSYNVGSALGNTISGALWTQILPGKLNAQLGNETLASLAYGSPFTFIIDYTWDTVERQQVVVAYSQIQRILCITGLCLSIPLLACTLVVRNPVLGQDQSLEDAEANAPVHGDKRRAVA